MLASENGYEDTCTYSSTYSSTYSEYSRVPVRNSSITRYCNIDSIPVLHTEYGHTRQYRYAHGMLDFVAIDVAEWHSELALALALPWTTTGTGTGTGTGAGIGIGVGVGVGTGTGTGTGIGIGVSFPHANVTVVVS